MHLTPHTLTAALVAAAVLSSTAPTTAHAAPAATRPPARTATVAGLAPTAPTARPATRPKAVTCTGHKYRTYKGRRLLIAAFCGRKMSDVEMVAVLRKAGWSWAEMPTALATFMGESNGWTQAVHYNRTADGRLLSVDLSWTQINTRWNPTILRINHRDPVAAARLAHHIKTTGGLKQWNAYGLRHRYAKRVAAAITAAHRAGIR